MNLIFASKNDSKNSIGFYTVRKSLTLERFHILLENYTNSRC